MMETEEKLAGIKGLVSNNEMANIKASNTKPKKGNLSIQ